VRVRVKIIPISRDSYENFLIWGLNQECGKKKFPMGIEMREKVPLNDILGMEASFYLSCRGDLIPKILY
jgi:hypothetical protein